MTCEIIFKVKTALFSCFLFYIFFSALFVIIYTKQAFIEAFFFFFWKIAFTAIILFYF